MINLEEIILDLENKLNIKIDIKDIYYFNDGATDSVVFSLYNKYLIKTVDRLTYDVQLEFFNKYKYDYFQKLIYGNKKLSYLCFSYIDGIKLKEIKDYKVEEIIEQIYNVVSNYKKYSYQGYGYLFSDYNKSWKNFLQDEVLYSKKEIENVSFEKVDKSLKIIDKYKREKYLIHGDFGVHNFLFNNNSLYVIDPMGVVGDYLYDFYFAIFSSPLIFSKVGLDYILSFFDDDLEYKKALLVVVLYIRMSRAFKYDKDNFNKYLNLYNEIDVIF